jgi:hypothetical protein
VTGKHSPGYQVAYQAALREAARRWREDNPDQWAQLLAGHVEAARPDEYAQACGPAD